MGSQEEFYRGSTSRTKTWVLPSVCGTYVGGTAAKGSSSSKEELCKKGDGVQQKWFAGVFSAGSRETELLGGQLN